MRVLGTPLMALAVFAAIASCAAPADSADRELGSLRHATVALDTGGGEREVVFLGGSLTGEDVAWLAREAPNLTFVQPDSDEAALARAGEAHGVDARYVTAEFLAAADELVWVQSPSAGVDRYLRIDALRESDLVMTNMQGAHGPTIAEHVFAMLLALTRDVRWYVQPEQRGRWARGGDDTDPIALADRTMLVVGLGGIGSEVAKRAHGFDMEVLATRRTASEPPPYVDQLGTAEDLATFLPRADVVVLCVPLTDETRGMIDAEALAAMPAGSYLVNIARGPVVDTDALVAALESGHLAGAALDVTDPEPLPAEHPLWEMPNVVITPHVAGRAGLTMDRWKQLYLANLVRFAQGEPLLNVVDKQAGY